MNRKQPGFYFLAQKLVKKKIKEGIEQTITKEADKCQYLTRLEENAERSLLKKRLIAIKQEDVQEIKINSPDKIREEFFKGKQALKPRHQRDIKRLISLVQSFALLNLWWRKRDGSTITANDDDINETFKVWNEISLSQEFNLPPYLLNLYNDVIMAKWNEKNGFGDLDEKVGLARTEIQQKHYQVYGRMLDGVQLRQQILPMLEVAGLISQEKDPSDKRKILVCPILFAPFS